MDSKGNAVGSATTFDIFIGPKMPLQAGLFEGLVPSVSKFMPFAAFKPHSTYDSCVLKGYDLFG